MFAAFVVAFVAFVVWRQPDGTRCSAHVLRIWPSAKSSPFTSLRIVRRRADAGERSGVQTKWSTNKFRANAWWYVLQSEVKGEASAWPKPEDMSGAVHATKYLHRQPVSEQSSIAKVVKRQRQIGHLFANQRHSSLQVIAFSTADTNSITLNSSLHFDLAVFDQALDFF